MPAFALTVFLGAFLLFQVQPLIGKFILPWFGGGPGVWTACMLFFQVLLLGGYAYAHFLSRLRQPRRQVIVHFILLLAALALLPIIPAESWRPGGGENPTLRILALLTATLGLPYFVLSATGPLLQHWFSLTNSGVSPYRLYALSNAGSLLALTSYPYYFETHFTRATQARWWAWGLVAFVICCALAAAKVWRKEPSGEIAQTREARSDADLDPPDFMRKLLWLLLPMCASVLLLATTNKLCQDVAVIPFLWVLPLGLYLLTFIISFDSPRWYAHFPFALALIAALALICWAMFRGTDVALAKQVAAYGGGLFICCLVCHGELYRLKPAPEHLTLFYLMIAAGGALGGLFVAVVAPLIFTNYYELHWGLLLCGSLFILVRLRDRNTPVAHWRWLACLLTLAVFGALDLAITWLGGQYPKIPKNCFIALRSVMWGVLVLVVLVWIVRKRFQRFQYWRLLTGAWLLLGLVGLAVTLWIQTRRSGSLLVHASRNFYGVLAVREYERSDPAERYFLLQHGRITHGLQFADPTRATWPTSYYGEESGVGLAIRALPSGNRHIGLVGLGTGTLAAYGEAGDCLRFYEINPDVMRLATSHFSYLSQGKGRVELVPGDARLSLDREAPQHFDLLVLDAFSSDAIPVHLLTKEAFEIYERHMNTNGIIAVHISNHFLDLEPVVVNLARHFNYQLALIDFDDDDNEWWLYSSTWILLSRSAEVLNSPALSVATTATKTNAVQMPLWTDDFVSVFPILKK